MKKLFVLFFILFTLTQQVAAQALHIDSTRFITGNRPIANFTYSIPTAEKGILLVGIEHGNPGGIIPSFLLDTVFENVLIGKIDSNQHISWIKVYGGSDDDYAVSACQTPDGGYAVLAGTASNNGDVTGFKGGSDMWLLRIDPFGNLLWEKTYGSNQSDGPISIANTPDHGFIMLGTTNGSDGDVPFHYGNFFSMDWLVVKTDSDGIVQWSKDLGGTGNEEPYGSILAVDSSYYLISSTSSNDHDCTDSAWHNGVYTRDDYYILKLDDTGKVLWDSSYGGSANDEVNYAFFDTRDSTILITGGTSSGDYMVTGYHGGGDVWVVKVDKNGTLLWQKALGDAALQSGSGICVGPEDGYMAYGGTSSITISAPDAWLFFLDNSGNVITDKIFGGTGYDVPYSIVPYLKGYAATGVSGSDTFTEGSVYGNFDSIGGAFVSYINYWPLAVNNLFHSIKQKLALYPNPAQSEVRIITPIDETGNIAILNTLGQVIYSKEIKLQNKISEINTSEWANGLYIVKWQGDNGSVLTCKLIKK